jgi:hypothetical protein
MLKRPAAATAAKSATKKPTIIVPPAAESAAAAKSAPAAKSAADPVVKLSPPSAEQQATAAAAAAYDVVLSSRPMEEKSKRSRVKSEIQKAKADFVTYAGRMKSGWYRRATSKEQAEAADALETYHDLTDDDKQSFALAFKANPKSWGWVKQYTESRLSHKTVMDKLMEKYRTRIHTQCAFCNEAALPHRVCIFLYIRHVALMLHDVANLPHAPCNVYSRYIACGIRTEVLSCHGLKMENFATTGEAFANADKLIQDQKEMLPNKALEFPDKIFPGFPMLDQFYYVEGKGLFC